MSDKSVFPISRRSMLAGAGAALTGSVLTTSLSAEDVAVRPADQTVFCLFSKPLHNRSYDKLPELLPRLGVDAVDLTCRPKGHVLPENAQRDLPRAVELLRDADIAVPMVTTGITDINKDRAKDILRTVARLKIKHVKLGYWPYEDLQRIGKRLQEVKAQLADISKFCADLGLTAGFHNHSGGPTVGCALWDLHHLLGKLAPRAIGSYFDIRHAFTEGGLAGWKVGMHLLARRIVMAAVKDFVWAEVPDKGWRPKDVPLGQGMVPNLEGLKMLRTLKFSGPVSLHMEHVSNVVEPGSNADKAKLQAIETEYKLFKQLGRDSGLI